MRLPQEYSRPLMPYLLTRGDDFRTNGVKVAGVFYRAAALKTLPVGVDLLAELIPEPGNPHDFNAVCVEVEGRQVGYIPARLASSWHDVIVRMNDRGFVVQCLCCIERLTEDELEFGVLLDLPWYDGWARLHAEFGLDDEFYALRDAVPRDLWQRLLETCWDGIDLEDQRATAAYRRLVPSAQWDAYASLNGAPVIPDRIVSRLRQEVKIQRQQQREEAERMRDLERERRTELGRKCSRRRRQGFTYARIADEFGVTPYMVKKLIAEAEAGVPSRFDGECPGSIVTTSRP